MFIFRIEHDREVCSSKFFTKGGESPTGHGTYMFGGCTSRDGLKPNFGLIPGGAPAMIMRHERCAVTADQFRDWIGEDFTCNYTSSKCWGSDYCVYCPAVFQLNLGKDWSILAYWVEDDAEGIDWREDRGQIVFNPAFAVNMGVVTLQDVRDFSSQPTFF